MDTSALRARFRDLHRDGTFVIPNPFDRGSARLLAAMGFEALATTSSGLAMSRGRNDMDIDRQALLDHVADLCEVVTVPVHVDAERGFADSPAGVAETVTRLADAGAAGCSIEDWDPGHHHIEAFDEAVRRVGAAADAADDHGMVLTARCENLIHGVDDLDDTIRRLVAYRDAGATVVYAPGLADIDVVRRVVEETASAVNVLLLPGGPTVADLAEAGVRRISLGGRLARAAYGACVATAQAVLDDGTVPDHLPRVPDAIATDAFTW